MLSGNRNFKSRVVRANFFASPPLVVAYALAGSLNVDITKESLGEDKEGNPVYLKDIWPSSQEITELVRSSITNEMFRQRYADVFKGDENWQNIKVEGSMTYSWPMSSTYVRNPPYFEGLTMEPKPLEDVENASILGLFLDSITTDHISSAGAGKQDAPAGEYLSEHQISVKDYNSCGARRGNHQVMMRGTFGNIRIKNQMVPGVEGGVTMKDGQQKWIYDASMEYKDEGTPLVIFDGKEYGTGSSRDWAAKGTRLLGVRAVIAQSFERIHRSNLVGMGVLPFTFKEGDSWQSLNITGKERITIKGVSELKPRQMVNVDVTYEDGNTKTIEALCRIDTEDELDYIKAGGILQYVLRNLVSA